LIKLFIFMLMESLEYALALVSIN